MFLAALLLAAITTQAETSRQLTASAEELLKIEKRVAAENDLDEGVLYEDVLSLLDAAIDADPENLHAHALEAGVLLLKSDNGDGTYDICYLLDARDEANRVLARGAKASAADNGAARAVLQAIGRIPPSAIPDPPSSCDEHQGQHGTKTRSS